ncbi:MAG: Hint domain-containing protein [Pseudomonadota bacterium]
MLPNEPSEQDPRSSDTSQATDVGDGFGSGTVSSGDDLSSATPMIDTHGASDDFPTGQQSVRLPDGAEITLSRGTLRLDDPMEIIRDTISHGVTGLCHGTRIRTPDGEKAIETLKPGDLVETLDSGARQIRWIGIQRFCGKGILAPIALAAGSLGSHDELFLMPEQRVLIRDWRAELLFGEPEVLVPARDLVNDTTIRPAPTAQATAYQLLLDHHDLIQSSKLETESFMPSEQSLMVMNDPARLALFALHPSLRRAPDQGFGPAIRPTLRPWEAKYLMS